jgi:hypothetical protein
VSDGHNFDVWVQIGNGKLVRPVLVSWMDVRSRKCVGHRITAGAENCDVILAAFRTAVEACGLPLRVYHDNGAAYDARGLQGLTKRQRRAGQRPQLDLGVFERLGVSVCHATPHNAKAKIIERFHRTICERFSKRYETYCGGSTASKPHDLQEKLAKGKAPTVEDFRADFEAWLEADYHNRAHEGEGMDGRTPAQVYADNLKEKRVVSEELLDLELSRRARVTVGRNGVTVNGIIYEAPELDSRMGQELTVLIADRINRVKMLDEAGRFLCIANSLRKTPANATQEELREAMQGIKRDRKRVKAAAPAWPRIADDPIERMHRTAAAKQAAAPQIAGRRGRWLCLATCLVPSRFRKVPTRISFYFYNFVAPLPGPIMHVMLSSMPPS